jgi:DNA ligase (NAD+)
MNPNPAIEIKQLADKINHYNFQYYQNHISEISDIEFDKLLARLQMLENQYPELAQPDSPTQRVGGLVAKDFVQVKHKYPMLSLSNTYNAEELREFDQRVAKGLENKPYEYICEMKYDGVAITLIYENGILTKAVTRGDGEQGDDVTQNVKTIKSVPLKVIADDIPDYFEVRGEIYMPRESFDKINAEIEEDNILRIKQGKKPNTLLANPRNAASGTVKMHDSGVVAKRNLACFVYDLLGENLPQKTQEENLQALKRWKFNVFEDNRKVTTIDEVLAYIAEWETKRYDLPFDTDGAVLKLNDKAQREILGFTSKSPKWAIAYKYKAENEPTILESVTYQVGRTGAVTPVANLKPVRLAGTTVKRATLHNANEIARLDLHEGDTVFVEKSGEIIPKITGVDKTKRSVVAQPIKYVSNCPECSTQLIRNEGEAIFFCPNEKGCPPQIKAKIEHYVSRKAMNIDSLGGKTIESLFENKLIRNVADLYELKFEQVRRLEGFKDTSTNNVIKGIENSKQQPFKNVLFGLGIRFVGETVAEKLANFFKNIDNLAKASVEELQQAPEIGERIAESIVLWFQDADNQQLIARLKAAAVQLESLDTPKVILSSKLEGKTFLISGTFENYGREELKDLIEQHGGKVLSGVSGKLNFLVAGNEAGSSKLEKAQKAGVAVISEAEFLAML